MKLRVVLKVLRGPWVQLGASPVATRQLFTSSVNSNQCKPRPKPDYGPLEVRRTGLLNGICVAAAKPMGSVIASCTVMFQAGSRFESDDELGATHFIRACSTASGCGYSSFMKMRLLQQYGVSVTCSADRQAVAFTMRCPTSSFEHLKYILHDMAARCCFNQYEVDDRKRIVREDLLRLQPRERVMDLIQTASWTNGLANSIYCSEERIDAMNENDLNCYVFNNYRTDEMTVASVGVPFEETIKLAERLEFRLDKRKPRFVPQTCPRAGFEYYDLGADSETWVAVAVPGCGSCADLKCLFMHAIVAEACGCHDVARGSHDMDRMPMAPLCAMAGSDIYTQYRAFNISYRERGIFGILVRTRACTAWNATLAASEFLAHIGDINFKQVQIGKARLKLSLALEEESCVRTSEGLALQMASCVRVDNSRAAMCLIDSIQTEEVVCVAKILASKCKLMSLALVGDVGAVPHDRELLCNK